VEHDLVSGLRDNFDARARWRSAITSARLVHRFGMAIKKNTNTSRATTDDESDVEAEGNHRSGNDGPEGAVESGVDPTVGGITGEDAPSSETAREIPTEPAPLGAGDVREGENALLYRVTTHGNQCMHCYSGACS
jgi:calcium/calmodulin-dependent protein kinase I